MTIPTISTLPTAPARTDPPATFVTRADSFLAALVVMQGELNTSIGAMNIDIAGVNADANAAADSATAAASSATAAANAAGAALWVSGQAYAEGDAAISGVNYQTYRAETATSGTTDPSLDANWTAISGTFPVQTGNEGKFLTTDGTNASWAPLTTDSTLGTLTKTFQPNESATITLTSTVLAPVVSVTKEVPQTGVTSNQWDVNSTTENYERLESAPATTLNFTGDYDISKATFTQFFSVASQETNPTGMAFSPDGTKMFIVGTTGDDVNEYDLSTGFDISTATFVDNFSVLAQEAKPEGIAFSTDGTKMFIVGTNGREVNEYTLSTGFDVSTASFVDAFSVAAQETGPTGIAFNNDGTKMFIVGTIGDDVNEYVLLTGFDVSTAIFVDSFSVASEELEPHGIAFNNDGTKMFIIGNTGDDINEYKLSVAFDVSTAFFKQLFSVAGQETVPQGIAFSTDGLKMFIIGKQNDRVNEYALDIGAVTLGTGSFTAADVGKTIEANDGVFVLTGTNGFYEQTTAPTSFNQVASGDWEMYGVVYDSISNSLKVSSFIDGYNLDIATYSGISFSVASQDTQPSGVAFSTDGSKMFIAGRTGEDINEYDLSTSFDVSTASFVDAFSVAAQDSQVNDIAFSTDGTKMFMIGATGDAVYEYTLSTGFDVSTASFVDSFSVAGQELTPTGLTFSTDGTKMFICGTESDEVNEYTLSTAFDVSTASFRVLFNVGSQESNPQGIAFNLDGTKMFIVGSTGDDVNEYNLSTGFDVSTASFTKLFSVRAQEAVPQGIAFNLDGTKMFIVGSDADTVFQYTTGVLNNTDYHAVHTKGSIDTTFWIDINSMTAIENAGGGEINYAVSTDDRTTWSVIDNTDGVRDIVRDDSGTWQYNSNATYASETWVNAATNTELSALVEAMDTAQNRMDKAQLDAVTDANQFVLTNDLDLAIVFAIVGGFTLTAPSSSGVAINYDANILNEGAVLGVDYDFDAPAGDKARITAIAGNNYKVRVV